MSVRIKLFHLGLVAFIIVGVPAASAQTSRADEAAIRQVVQQVQDAWNAHDAKAFAAPFAADADYVVINGMMIQGREAIEKGHVGIFTTIYKDSHNVGTVKNIRVLRPEVAVVHIEWNLEVQPGGEREGAMNTMIMTKDGSKWSIAAFQNTPIREQRR